VTSIASNIAEGCGRDTDKDFARFLTIAAGSASEARYQILLARDLGYLSEDRYKALDSLAREVERMMSGLVKTLS
jgi:four helix bundle protein